MADRIYSTYNIYCHSLELRPTMCNWPHTVHFLDNNAITAGLPMTYPGALILLSPIFTCYFSVLFLTTTITNPESASVGVSVTDLNVINQEKSILPCCVSVFTALVQFGAFPDHIPLARQYCFHSFLTASEQRIILIFVSQYRNCTTNEG